MANETGDEKRIDQPTGTEFVGHEWDGIEELDTPMPRWWLWTFYATIAWGIIYTILYPAWPLVNQATEGVLGWTSRGQLAQEMSAADMARQSYREQLAAIDVVKLQDNPELMQRAVAGGAAAFKVNCVQCHGAGAAGSPGYPNLNDDEWIWGGDLQSIETTLLHGVRWDGSDETRFSLMPGFGDIFTAGEISSLASHVMSFTGRGQSSPVAAELYDINCASCHQSDGSGDRAQGAPALNDAIWLYGGSEAEIRQQIRQPSHGVMPGWKDRLDPVTIKMLAAYVHSRGGGEDIAQIAEEPAAGDDEQP
ncbi:cytochrome-c oxidase, cbb3-type subunit III [Altererythrobacter sp. MF3-039]|uniref:cytochrome-c oxidase, cbb3-type subunit III n=1 Tax=Altererythrobacter sp. MF3-039 TaxID=3252901 RepID=UPI00390C535C